ncbi:TfuA-like protein [Kribbella sp. CA-294648]|uniref:TfuA-like protein n=1 Tax=Kribbella sp. CA-294648 TaxID=3239948 RepID=UPI003D90E626
MTKTYVFIGPSAGPLLSSAAPMDGVSLLPPAQAGDLLNLDVSTGDLVVLVDGYFYNRPAVRHKEILYLLDRGVHVHGAASMGALRAAELHPYGMVGHGTVFAAYRDGHLVGDDEVAVLHADAENCYRPLTEALVTIRHKLRCAVTAGVCDPELAHSVIRTAKAVHFSRRTWRTILTRASTGTASAPAIAKLEDFLLTCSADIKQADAASVLSSVEAGNLAARPGSSTEWIFQETSMFLQWKSPEPEWLRLCRLFATDYPAFHEAAALADLEQRGPRTATVGTAGKLTVALQFAADVPLIDLTAPPSYYSAWLLSAERTLPTEIQMAKVAARSLYGERTRLKIDPMLQAATTSPAHLEANKHLLMINKYRSQASTFDQELDPQRIINWFRERWGVEAADVLPMVRARGFDNIRSFLHAARPYYLVDRYHQMIHLKMTS